MKQNVISTGMDEYETAFRSFVGGYKLPKELFSYPDHLAIKCANELDYVETCLEIASEADEQGVWELTESGRLLASAKLAGNISLADLEFGWLEIMQPRPGKETSKGFVEHTEFLFPDFYRAQTILERHGIDSEIQGNGSHEWVNVVIDEIGREIKFNNALLERVVEIEREQGILRPLALEDGF